MFPHETITVGETLAGYCRERYGRETTCIPNGVMQNAECRTQNGEVSSVLDGFDLVRRKYLLVVSRLVPHKGVHTVIAAFRQLKRERQEFRDLQLAIVGAPAFTEAYVDELKIQAAGDPSIRFLGPQFEDTLQALFQHCLAFVHGSKSEGLPIAVLEAAAAGAVPIVSDIPEHREVIDRVGGFCFRTNDVHDCVLVLDVVLRSAASLPRIGREIQRAVLKHYDWDCAAAKTAGCYREGEARERMTGGGRVVRPRFAV
jgi:glycosyltransferase involved in cell wall biosynthesis